MSTPTAAFPNPNPTNILIIEGNLINTFTMKEMLNSFGFYNVTIAKSAKEAIQLFSENFHLIIMDYNLPDMNAIQLTTHFRQVFPKGNTPIILWSTLADQIRNEGINAGIDDFLSKPTSIEELQQILECWTFYGISTNKSNLQSFNAKRTSKHSDLKRYHSG